MNDRQGSGNMKSTTYLGLLTFALLVFPLTDILLRDTHRIQSPPPWTESGGDPEMGRKAIITFGCGGCHVIPGVREAKGRVGPKLEDFAGQIFIAGILPNNPENLARWIQNPRKFSPQTAMPNLGVSESVAADMAAYLFSVE